MTARLLLALIVAATVACTAPAHGSPATDEMLAAASAGGSPTVSSVPEAPSVRPAAASRSSGASPAGQSPAVGGTRTPSAATSLTGLASWYRDYSRPILGLYAAVPSWRWGDHRYRVRVRSGGRSVVVTILDACGCPGRRIVDLSPAAFRRLAPLSRGVVAVTVELLR